MTDWSDDDHISLLATALVEKTPDEKRIITKRTGLANNPNCKFGPTDNNNRIKMFSSGILTMKPKLERSIGLTAGQQSKALITGNSRANGRDSLLPPEKVKIIAGISLSTYPSKASNASMIAAANESRNNTLRATMRSNAAGSAGSQSDAVPDSGSKTRRNLQALYDVTAVDNIQLNGKQGKSKPFVSPVTADKKSGTATRDLTTRGSGKPSRPVGGGNLAPSSTAATTAVSGGAGRGRPAKKVKPSPEVIDLANSDDEEEEDDDRQLLQTIIDDSAGRNSFKTLSAIGGSSKNPLDFSSKHAPVLIDVPASYVYLGQLQFHSDVRDMRMLLDANKIILKLNSVHDHPDSRAGSDSASAGDSATAADGDAVESTAEATPIDSLGKFEEEHIPWECVKAISFGNVEQPVPNDKAKMSRTQQELLDRSAFRGSNMRGFIAILLHPDTQSSTLLKSVCIGDKCRLNPNVSAAEQKDTGTKYILLITRKKNVENFVTDLRKHDTLRRYIQLKQRSDLEPLVVTESATGPGAMVLAHTLSRQFSRPGVLAQAAREREAAEHRASRASRRRRSSTAHNTAISDFTDPEDCVTYLVYPTAVDSLDAITIHKGDLRRLGAGEYLNDNLIDLRVKHMLANDITPEQRSRVHAFSCLFYGKLTEAKGKPAHTLVCRWTKNVDLFALDFVIIPINLGLHWSLCVVVRPGALIRKMSAFMEQCQADRSDSSSSSSSHMVDGGLAESKPLEGCTGGGDVVPSSNGSDKENDSTPVDANISSSPAHHTASSILDALSNVMHPSTTVPSGTPTVDGSSQADETCTEAKAKDSSAAKVSSAGDGSECCLLFMDSLGMHNSGVIGRTIVTYLFHEWETRERIKWLRAKQQAQAQSQSQSQSQSHGGVKVEDNGQQGGDLKAKAEASAAVTTADTANTAKPAPAIEKCDPAVEKELLQTFAPAYNITKAGQEFRQGVPSIRVAVPQQENGYDCGVYTIKFAERVLAVWPSSSAADLANSFSSHFSRSMFKQSAVDAERLKMRTLLESIKIEWEAAREQYRLEHGSTAGDSDPLNASQVVAEPSEEMLVRQQSELSQQLQALSPSSATAAAGIAGLSPGSNHSGSALKWRRSLGLSPRIESNLFGSSPDGGVRADENQRLVDDANAAASHSSGGDRAWLDEFTKNSPSPVDDGGDGDEEDEEDVGSEEDQDDEGRSVSSDAMSDTTEALEVDDDDGNKKSDNPLDQDFRRKSAAAPMNTGDISDSSDSDDGGDSVSIDNNGAVGRPVNGSAVRKRSAVAVAAADTSSGRRPGGKMARRSAPEEHLQGGEVQGQAKSDRSSSADDDGDGDDDDDKRFIAYGEDEEEDEDEDEDQVSTMMMCGDGPHGRGDAVAEGAGDDKAVGVGGKQPEEGEEEKEEDEEDVIPDSLASSRKKADSTRTQQNGRTHIYF